MKHLRLLNLADNPRIKKYSGSIHKLQNLQYLSLEDCEDLEGLTQDVKYFISLRMLVLIRKQKHLPNYGIGCLNSLWHLLIDNCSNLEYLCEDIGGLRALQKLGITNCPSLSSLPRSVRSLSSLEVLYLRSCERLNINFSIGSDNQDNQDELNNIVPPLRVFIIMGSSQLVELPQWLLQCCSNTSQTLTIVSFSKLKALPESMQKLRVLNVWICPEFSSLPKDINHLSHQFERTHDLLMS